MTLNTNTHIHTYSSVRGRLVSHPGFAGPKFNHRQPPNQPLTPSEMCQFFMFFLCRVLFLNPPSNLKPQFSSFFSPTFSLYSNFNCRCFHISLCIAPLPSPAPSLRPFPSFIPTAFSYLCHSVHVFGRHISKLIFFFCSFPSLVSFYGIALIVNRCKCLRIFYICSFSPMEISHFWSPHGHETANSALCHRCDCTASHTSANNTQTNEHC